MHQNPNPDSQFNQHRSRLFGIAYRMLGSRADAEDVVQDAYLRWHQSAAPENAEAWLVTVATHLCIDRLRKAKLEREVYTGPWLPEPLIAADIERHTPESIAEFSSDVSTAFLVVLEQLGVEERAAFLLHEVFDVDYQDIAQMLDKSEAACRQLVHRARSRVRRPAPRFNVSREAHLQLLEKFIIASKSGDHAHLSEVFAADATFTADGGGKIIAALKVLHGLERLARLFLIMARDYAGRAEYKIVNINGEPGVLRYIDGELDAASSFEIEMQEGADGQPVARIKAMYLVRNPDKLHMS
ncbi:RNA polymerase sigma factor SigJ [Collimonas silvisoli]|uniref:RNA polymerase sigma factor SigJ n=1 Tax=Collimonas silvisoli TaxID=2825884 RepID=UPI001B8CAFCB|nr:RNA polymerase sigma factor SigJ [Collimonas silvisoli]